LEHFHAKILHCSDKNNLEDFYFSSGLNAKNHFPSKCISFNFNFNVLPFRDTASVDADPLSANPSDKSASNSVKSATAKFVFVDEQQEEKNGEEKA
jgi:hypothetical protein